MSDKVVDISEIKKGYPWYDDEPSEELAHSDDLESVDIYEDDPDEAYIRHYGTPRHSGRYPWGSGENPYQRSAEWRKEYTKLLKSGMSAADIAKHFNMNSSELRAKISNTKAEVDAYESRQIIKMREKGMSWQAITDKMGYANESTTRSKVATYLNKKANQNKVVADMLSDAVKEKGLIDISRGTSESLGITETRLKNAVALLKEKGYVQGEVYIQQATNPDQYTTIKVLAPPGTDPKDIYKNRYDIKTVMDIHKETDDDGNETFYSFEPPKSIDSKRVFVKYSDVNYDDGFTGEDRDGLIQLRRGVEDISLGNSLYKQVRIGVDGTNYMKGMAVYSDDIPEGYDVVYNTNKKQGTPLFDGKEPVFKKMKTIKVENPETGEMEEVINKDDPFGALIKPDGQRHYKDKNGNEQLSVINSIRDESDWDDWSRNLPTQFLSKQSTSLIKKQLEATYADKKAEYEEICSLTNDQIKKKLLIDFADGLDKSAVDLKTRSLPGQSVKVILPDPNVKDGEVYAPQYKNGEYVALVRYPHEGTFQIPILKVNNNVKSAKQALGEGKDTAMDAICINKKTADKLSGADFDGDTVTVIPTNGSNGVKIASKPSLKALENFDAKVEYAGYEGMKVINKQDMQKQMGVISNLITDMTISGAATDAELARATRYSMTVIDSYKHKLDYKAAYADNGIEELQMKYQGKKGGGAATLFSKAKSQARIDQVKEGDYLTDPITGKTKLVYIDSNTGEKIYRKTGKTSTKLPTKAKRQVEALKNDPDLDAETKNEKIREIYAENGQDYNVQTVTTKMADALRKPAGARALSSGTVKENMYADYADSLYALANQARLKYLDTPDIKRDSKAAKDYAPEVESLRAKVSISMQNAPRERQAQLLANKRADEAIRKDPDLKDDKKELKKLKSTLIQKARREVGADGKGTRISITDKEWEAIQANAISASLLKQILDHTDTDAFKERAMPRSNGNAISTAKQNQIKARAASGYTSSEIAESLGLSVSTVLKYLK